MKNSNIFSKQHRFDAQNKTTWKKNIQTTTPTVNYKGKIYDSIYFQNEIHSTHTFNKKADWHINAEINIINEKQANKEALKLLNLGVDSICFLNFKEHNLKLILKNIQIDIIYINFRNFQDIDTIANQLIELATTSNIKLSNLKGIFHNKSISKTKYQKWYQILPNYRFLEISIERFKKLNYKTKTYINKEHILFTHNTSKLLLWEIAYLRSFRIEFESEFKITPYIACQIKITDKKIHPLIESSVSAIASILGGCSSLTTMSHISDEFHIKQQLILKHESHMNKVSDSLHGSYYIEKITQSLYTTKKTNRKKIEKKHDIKRWNTDEEIILKSKYYSRDVKKVKHLNFGAGIPPYLRGPYLTMYCDKKWTIRQYSGFSTATESNAFYKQNLAAGQSGLSVAFDLPTHRGYDSDHQRVLGDVGKAGVAIDSIEDMETLFEGINLEKTSVSMTMNGAIIPIMAFFIAVVKNKKIPLNKIRGTIQNDILKEFMVRNTYIYPPKESMRIVSDIFKYVAQNMPKFNSISVSGYHMLEAGASADIELAYTLADGLEYIRTGIKSGLKIDEFAPRLSFFWGIGMNFCMEIAKMRAARMLWAEMIQSFNPKNPKSMMLRSHCQTSGWSLTAQEPINNITRTTIEAIAATIGGTQSLHTNALDEAISLPTTYSAKIARDTQIFLQNETDICKTIDSFGGSYYIEQLTDQIKEKAKKHIQEIESAGGMLKAIEKGIPKLKIETSAVKRQANIDNGKNLIIGLNCFQNNQKNNLDVLDINNQEVQKIQIENIKKIRRQRNEKIVQECLKKITAACKLNNENLLDLAVKAAEAKATTGEISNALELVFGRHEAHTQIISGIYEMEQKNDTNFILAKKLTQKFENNKGRRPRILTAKLGQDGHDRGIKIIATSFSDIGFDVDIAPLFQTPKEIAKQAIENDVHIIGISSLAGGHKTLIPELIKHLHEKSRHDIMIIAGGIIPEKDHKYLMKKGVIKIFGPGTIVIEAAIEILNELLKK